MRLHRLCLFLIPLLSACRGHVESNEPAGVPTANSMLRTTAGGERERPSPSPPGPWRRAPANLDRTLLWLSHIVIRHADVEAVQVSFNVTGWLTAQQIPVQRPRREALRLAEQLADSARRGAAFDDLARRFSEEPETAALGGSLGAVVAGHLTAWPDVLDAVATLKPGEVSNVVETQYGYHVLQLRAPPQAAQVSGSRIVISHAAAPWLKLFSARASLPDRSREEARAIAQEVFERVRARPDDFAALAAQFSDHRDATRGGDFGEWSTHEIGYAREIERLASLDVGAVAAPLDTMYGYQILRRTPNRPRQRYAMSKVAVRFDHELTGSEPGSRAAAAQKIEQLMAQLRQDQNQFATLQQQICCRHTLEVVEGRQAPELEAVLARLAPGQLAAAPIRDGNLEYLIPKRLPIEALPPRPAMLFALPGAPGAAGIR